jgi:hypothetical protein
MNPTGYVRLTQWAGRHTKDGSEYEYAFDGNLLLAQPKLPPHIARSLEGKTKEELPKAMLQIMEHRNSLGPFCQFVLSDR